MALKCNSQLVCLLATSAFLQFSISPALALVFNVSNTNDTYKHTSLRGAVIFANRIPGKHLIILGGEIPGPQSKSQSRPQTQVFHLTIPGADEEQAKTGDLDIYCRDLTIIGATSNVVIDATGFGDRVFDVFPSAKLTLINVTITGGTAPGNIYASINEGEPGGAILNFGTLFLSNCILSGNASGGGNLPEGNVGYTGGGNGGGICNYGRLTMINCFLNRNSTGDGSEGGSGGGLENDGTGYLTNCVVLQNRSGNGSGPFNLVGAGGWGGNGGGIFNAGAIVLDNCLVAANTNGSGGNGGSPSGWIILPASGGPGGGGGNGGGMYNAGQMLLRCCTVASNLCGNGGNGDSSSRGGNAGAGGGGAGVFNAGTLSIGTSTISQNLCGNGGIGGNGSFDGFGAIAPATGGIGGDGGGIHNAGSLNLTSCTITLNQTGAGGQGGNSQSFGTLPTEEASGGPGGDGGGVYNAGDNAVILQNTLIAQNLINVGGGGGTNVDYYQPTILIGNAGPYGIGFDLAGNFTSVGFNLISISDGGTGMNGGVNSDQMGSLAAPINPLLGPLQMNGGATPTHALLPGSPAIDQGNSLGLKTDQRGKSRPYKFQNISSPPGGDASDIGAFELE